MISDEFGIFIREDFNIQVHVDSAVTSHFIVPPSPRITEEELARITGGTDSNKYGRRKGF
ncbi:MAG: hypothetical protein F4X34_05770 [Chloroflexi bacterium]|nr:hypothetical protein [Chloroflexota bacterium]